MSYWNRDEKKNGTPHRLYCDRCFHNQADGTPGRIEAWALIRPECATFTDYVRGCYTSRGHYAELIRDRRERIRVREHLQRMRAPMTPNGWAWDRRYGLETVCDHCGVPA